MGNNKKKKKLNERGKQRLNAKLECHLVGPHALSHEVFKRETFCNTFYSTIFLQIFFFLTYSLNWIIIMVICVQFITVVSLHIYSLFKVRLIFHPKKKKVRLLFFKKNHKTKNKCKKVTGLWKSNNLCCVLIFNTMK